MPAIITKHGTIDTPETYSAGATPIDEIFVSSTLNISGAGYLEHGSTQGDHRPIWIDVHKETALGTKYPDLPSHKARRLKCQDPRIVKRYLKTLDRFYKKHKIYERAYQLFHNFSYPLSEQQQHEYEALDNLRVTGMKFAEKKCRKLKMGGRKWSPLFETAQKRSITLKLPFPS